ncbi:hypothetical protein ACPCSF_14795 [Streptomyces griseoincarnatus]
MGLYRENGQRITKAAFPAAALADPPKRITENVSRPSRTAAATAAPKAPADTCSTRPGTSSPSP